MEAIKIGNRLIGPEHPPLVIAEMRNHNQSLERALDIVDVAAQAGADVGVSDHTADTITLNVKGGDFRINDELSLWNGQNLHDSILGTYPMGMA